MTVYTPAKIAKALAALAVGTLGTAITSAGGPTLDQLAALDPGAWLAAAGVGLTSGAAVFATPNKGEAPAATADQADAIIDEAWQKKADADAAVESIAKKVEEKLRGTTDPLAADVIDSFR